MYPDGRIVRATAERFTRSVALRYEQIYGPGYQGPASEAVFDRLASRLEMSPGVRILDVGSGLGGDAIRLARKYGAIVTGLDAAPDMTRICLERHGSMESEGQVDFATGDVRTSKLLAPGAFNVVWMRDCGMYLPRTDKPNVWQRLHATLRCGGRLLITDYCKGVGTEGLGFSEQSASWYLLTVPEYVEELESAGFSDVLAEDRSADLLDSMREGRDQIARSGKSDLLHWWNQKIASCERGGLKWPVLTATRY
ncbi:methyltransferase domain-containing protein [Streptomyces goshikiensis]|uniref:methyltransferase domain-containing protein n=1 Tax=Streptomyces goshikiensis TaxID=1942 RepID=UPI003656E413